MKEWKTCLQNYVNFKGRARRREYWMILLVNFIVYMLFSMMIYLLSKELGTMTENLLGDGMDMMTAYIYLGVSAVLSLYSLAMVIPGFAVLFRRLHDIGKSGVWILIVLVPIAGFIILLVFLLTDSQAGENKYGPNPKEEQK